MIANAKSWPKKWRYRIPILSPCVTIIKSTSRWYITAWQTCSLSCGKGFQQRSVLCRQKISKNEWNTITNEALCAEPKPTVSPLKRSCNEINCPPEYVAGKWSEVNERHVRFFTEAKRATRDKSFLSPSYRADKTTSKPDWTLITVTCRSWEGKDCSVM